MMEKLLRDPAHRRRIALKRAADTVLVLAAAPVAVAMGGAAALATRIALGNPVIFKQTRIGLGEKPFTLYKFRSMLDEEDEEGNPREPSERLTPFGRFLRKSSLDEVPQLWNVLKGDMSLIGPRPLTPDYLPFYLGHERVRHAVRPGLTGLAQTRGRNLVGWDQRLALDAVYAIGNSDHSDFTILLKTVSTVFASQSVVDPGAAKSRLDDART